jgi:hypothetical protein
MKQQNQELRVPQYDVELRLAAEVCDEYRIENATLKELLKEAQSELLSLKSSPPPQIES